MLELRAAPMGHIYYTTEGSDPKLAGATYEAPFPVPPSAQLVLAYAEHNGVASDVLRVPVPVGGGAGPTPVDPRRPAVWVRCWSRRRSPAAGMGMGRL